MDMRGGQGGLAALAGQMVGNRLFHPAAARYLARPFPSRARLRLCIHHEDDPISMA